MSLENVSQAGRLAIRRDNLDLKKSRFESISDWRSLTLNERWFDEISIWGKSHFLRNPQPKKSQFLEISIWRSLGLRRSRLGEMQCWRSQCLERSRSEGISGRSRLCLKRSQFRERLIWRTLTLRVSRLSEFSIWKTWVWRSLRFQKFRLPGFSIFQNFNVQGDRFLGESTSRNMHVGVGWIRYDSRPDMRAPSINVHVRMS